MTRTEQEVREAVVKEALTWQRTPYHHMGRVKGAGVDCAMLLAEVYQAAGAIPRVDDRFYARDWHLNREEQKYLEEVMQHASEIDGLPKPGDVVVWQFGRCFSHGAIVIEWPLVLHAYLGQGCQLEDAERAKWLCYVGEGDQRPRPRKFFSLWGPAKK